ncbi:exonuclease subunit SbcD [Zobellella endophytica]|uniref:Nuclease SbcCD subunit D n=1 Tax=Zobellella endophytica TaxID=2116700 RepID=A0A2P7R0E8_9GAMM|nr:exonuclease subunit SbcD [Zobellella endophytica]PSJ43694.1 exonuclease subunit SbcD [Zobellella endophytica]
MRILHTSDWHLGQHFMGKTRLDEHQAFLSWLVEQVRQQEVAAVLVAGDLFDTGTPPSYARELYNRFIVELQQTGAQLVILGGNHDSVAMLNESRELLGCLNVSVIPGVLDAPGDHLLELRRADGEPGALLCAVPFLRSRDLLESRAGQSGQDKQQALQQAIADHYRALFELAEGRRAQMNVPLPIIATGHLTTVGARSSDSVREIYIGTLEAFPASAFPPADYIALGHIHRPQKVAGLEHVRYCGSPIPLSFDEVGQQKEVLLVEFAGGSLERITPLPVPVFQPLARIDGSLDELAASMAELAENGSETSPVWLEVTVTGDDYLSDLQPRVEALAEGLPLEILLVRRQRPQSGNGLAAVGGETLSELTPEEVFERRLAAEQLASEEETALEALHRQLLAQLEDPA